MSEYASDKDSTNLMLMVIVIVTKTVKSKTEGQQRETKRKANTVNFMTPTSIVRLCDAFWSECAATSFTEEKEAVRKSVKLRSVSVICSKNRTKNNTKKGAEGE